MIVFTPGVDIAVSVKGNAVRATAGYTCNKFSDNITSKLYWSKLCLGVTLPKLTIYKWATADNKLKIKTQQAREEGKFGIPGLCPQPNTRPPVVHAMVNQFVVTPAIFSPAKSRGTWRQKVLFRRSSPVAF
jgi:hypothetical protein